MIRKPRPSLARRPPVRTQEESIDELLEFIWTLREKGVTDIHSLLENTSDPEARAVLNYMMKEGLF